MTSVASLAPVLVPVSFLFPGKRQLIPRGMSEWEPDGCDDGDQEDVPVDDREVAEDAAG